MVSSDALRISKYNCTLSSISSKVMKKSAIDMANQTTVQSNIRKTINLRNLFKDFSLPSETIATV